jgi:hypothetical protein
MGTSELRRNRDPPAAGNHCLLFEMYQERIDDEEDAYERLSRKSRDFPHPAPDNPDLILLRDLMSESTVSFWYEFEAKLDIGTFRPAIRATDSGENSLRPSAGN